MRIASNTLLAGIAVIGLSGDVFALPIWSHHADNAPSAGDQATRSNVPLNLAFDRDFGDRHGSRPLFSDVLFGVGQDPTDMNYDWSGDSRDLSQSDPCAELGWKCTATGNDGDDFDVIGDVLNNPLNDDSPGTGPKGPLGNGFAFNGPSGNGPSGGNSPNNGPHFHGPSGPFNFIPPGNNFPSGPTFPFGGNPPGINPPGNGPTGPFAFNPPGNGPTGPFIGNLAGNGPNGPSGNNPPNDDPPIINLADNGPPGDNPPNNDPPGNDPPNNDPPGDNPPNNNPPPLGLAPLNTPLLLDVNLPDPPANPVPAPAGIALFGIGLASTAFLRRRKESPHK